MATGPPRIGKCTLISSLVKTYSRQTLTDVKGPVTAVSGRDAWGVHAGLLCSGRWGLCVQVCACVDAVSMYSMPGVWVVKVYMWIYSCESYGYMLYAIMYISSVGAVGGAYF